MSPIVSQKKKKKMMSPILCVKLNLDMLPKYEHRV